MKKILVLLGVGCFVFAFASISYAGKPVPTGCAAYEDEATCVADSTCQWTVTRKGGECEDKVVDPPVDGVIRILTAPRYGEYCYDPSGWLQQGYNVGIWGPTVPIKAQGIDNRGWIVATDFTWSAGQEGGAMDGRKGLYTASVPTTSQVNYTVTADGTSATDTIYRHDATCTACHATPPGHIADSANWGRCHDCHNLGNVMHVHAFNAGIAVDNCYACHPMNCFSDDVHASNPINLWCTDCHGDLADSLTNSMGISGQAGKPQCADCHDAQHSETGLYCDDSGHGTLQCISCHSSPHRVKAVAMTCAECHPEQPTDNNMGPDCAQCHVSSTSPHLVVK